MINNVGDIWACGKPHKIYLKFSQEEKKTTSAKFFKLPEKVTLPWKITYKLCKK